MKRIVSLAMFLVMLFACVSACAESNVWENAHYYEGIDFSEPVKLTYYFIGNEAEDWPLIEEKVNALMKERINTTIDFVHVSFANYQTNYALYLAGGDDIDIIYGGTLMNYQEHAAAGAYHELTEEFIQKYMPMSWKYQAPTSWDEAKVNGSIYAVTGNRYDVTYTGVVTSRNLLNKYGYSENNIHNISDLSEYLKAVAAGEKDSNVYAINCQNGWPSDWVMLASMGHRYEFAAGSPTWMVWEYNKGKEFSLDDLHWYADDQLYKDWALMMADWYKSGVYRSDVQVSETMIREAYLDGLSAIEFMTPAQASAAMDTVAARGDELVYLDILFDDETRICRGSYMGHLAAFPNGSDNFERAAVALDVMKFDKDIHYLLMGGIEGADEHYTLNDEGNLRYLGAKADRYAWANRMYYLQNDSDPSLALNDYTQKFQNRYLTQQVESTIFPLIGFTYDNSKYTAEIATISAMMAEYRFCFCFGLYGDQTEAKVQEYLDSVRAAGLDDIIADFKAQAAEYIANKKK